MPVYDGGLPSTTTTPMPLTNDPADINKIVTIQGGYTDYVDNTTSPAHQLPSVRTRAICTATRRP